VEQSAAGLVVALFSLFKKPLFQYSIISIARHRGSRQVVNEVN
jgi:hypothetical protein